VTLYGYSNEAPSPLHKFDCQGVTSGLKCSLGPVSKQQPNEFKLAIASDQKQVPLVTTTDDTVTFVPLEQYLSTNSRPGRPIENTITIIVIVLQGGLLIVFIIMLVFERPLKALLLKWWLHKHRNDDPSTFIKSPPQ
jgi:hypothetical protein